MIKGLLLYQKAFTKRRMIIQVPYTSFTLYFRDFLLGTLMKFLLKNCFFCEGDLRFEMRLRKAAFIPIFRAKCMKCKKHFTFLPSFLPPRKWYMYKQIEYAIESVADFNSIAEGLSGWNEMREDSILDKEPVQYPSVSTVIRWNNNISRIPQDAFFKL